MEEYDVESILDMYEDSYVSEKGKTGTFRNTGNTSPVKTEKFKYPRTNRFGTVYSDTPAGGKRRNIITEEVGEEIIEKFRKGFSSVELEQQYGIDNDTILKYVKKKEPNIKVAKKDKRRLNQYNFDKSVIDEIVADAPNMSRKMILKKYGDRISKKKLDSLKLKFGIVEEAGRPRISPGERSTKQVKRVNRIKNAQGFDVSGTFAKNFHHVFPIGGLSELSAQDVMILDKKFNETLGGFNLQLNDIADEIGSMDLSDPSALKKLNDLNAKSKDLVNRAKAKLPKELQNAIGYIEYNPVFDENGTIFELSQVRKGIDVPMGALPAEFGTKKFKDYTPEEIKKFKTRVKQLALQAGDEGTMFAANVIPKKLLTKSLGDMAMSLGSPTALLGLNAYLGVDPRSSLDRAILGTEAALAPAGIKALTSRLDTIKNPAVRKGIETVAGLRLPGVFTPANVLRAARFASPLGIATLAGEGLYQVGKLGYEEQQRVNEMRENDPEAYQRYLAEQQELSDVSA
jgi:hypothetical protein|tara:strand:+ start:139 stop:1680 length:1542 start_codon:yes stop_codon:yes gene_type:complete